jgi:GMP synthase-like glutamine amidotransferase
VLIEEAAAGPFFAAAFDQDRYGKIMRMAVLQHVPFEGPAAIGEWARPRAVAMSVAHLYRGDPPPHLDSFDMLAVMGGPMSANDEAVFDWLGSESALVRDAIASGKSVLGVCLGAQIIAKALGGRVYKGRQKEIGWFPVARAAAAHPLFEGLPQEFVAFHWHGETFSLPENAVRLASTPSTENQAFAMGDKVLGLQFHLEATPDSVAALIENAASDIEGGPYQQQPAEIQAGAVHCAEMRPHLFRLLDALAGFTPNS